MKQKKNIKINKTFGDNKQKIFLFFLKRILFNTLLPLQKNKVVRCPTLNEKPHPPFYTVSLLQMQLHIVRNT